VISSAAIGLRTIFANVLANYPAAAIAALLVA
jgi:hypothetical protein